MPKTLILYRSPHHGNTKKLLDAIAGTYPDVALAKAGEDSVDAAQFDIIGIASGIYAGKLHRTVRKALSGLSGNGRKAFVLYTCGDDKGAKYSQRCLQLLRDQGFQPMGSHWCVAWDSFGPLKLVGGIHKDRPNQSDIQNAVEFFETIVA